jgi:DNA repair protein RadA/Sms
LGIKKQIETQKQPIIVIIDSIQTMFLEGLSSAPGTVSQVRATAGELTIFAKQNAVTLLIVSHVTKDGQIAGPKVLEHMVDTVLYFEGEKDLHFRILRAVKNRFGAANEIGVFAMNEIGLSEVSNPSELFLNSYQHQTSVFAGIEGTRPILAEIQALVAPSFLPTPRRAVVGWDLNRLAMIIAVLNSRYGLNLFDKEVYLNVVGGLKIIETSADLAVACALISASKDIALPACTLAIGEIGLTGEIRMIGNLETRLKEAQTLGFKNCLIPQANAKNKSFLALKKNLPELNFIEVSHIRDLAKIITIKK